MEKMTDTEVLARLIYRAYIAPDPQAPLEAEALLPFRAALDLYARTWRADMDRHAWYGDLLRQMAKENSTEGCGDCCPVELPEDVPESDTAAAPEPENAEPAAPPPLRAHATHTHTHRGGG